MLPSDPTELHCEVCRASYPLNVPRVVRAISGNGAANVARLCWVCARLHSSVEVEEESTEFRDIECQRSN
jgi:hypothetical protein